MALISWKDSYSVKVKEMDDQHRKLVDMINQFHAAMKVGKEKEVVGSFLAGLTDYTRRHFTSEENLLRIHGYSGYEEQSKAHDNLVSQVEDIRKKYSEGSVQSKQVISFLKEWLILHIQGMDRDYGPHLNGKGVE
jgi:hemerythrin